MHFTLDQLLSIVPTFKQQLLSKFQAKLKHREVEKHTPVWEAFQMIPKDVDFRVPTVEVTYEGKVYKEAILDGGSGVNILLESTYLEWKNVSLLHHFS